MFCSGDCIVVLLDIEVSLVGGESAGESGEEELEEEDINALDNTDQAEGRPGNHLVVTGTKVICSLYFSPQ